jgi:hypothetical protein
MAEKEGEHEKVNFNSVGKLSLRRKFSCLSDPSKIFLVFPFRPKIELKWNEGKCNLFLLIGNRNVEQGNDCSFFL